MDDILKRLVAAYLGFTAALWLVSGAMAMNGSAHSRNYAWAIVSNLRLYFTAPLVLAFAAAAGTCLFWFVMESREQQQKALQAREQNQREQLVAEERKRQAEEEAGLRAKREAARLAQQADERAEARRQEQERQKKKKIEKQTRSASAAAERALDDF